jgi:hypothetical protein
MWKVMTTCVIIHNIIVEDERDDSLYDLQWDYMGELIEPQCAPTTLEEFLHVYHEIYDETPHFKLQND